MKKIKDNRRGSTLVEVIVTFALIGMFLLAATTAVSAAMNAFYRMESLSRVIVVSDTILDKAQGELSLASADGALLCLGGESSGDDWWKTICFYSANGNPVRMESEASGDGKGRFSLYYYPVKDSSSQGTDWTFDENFYQGFWIEDLLFRWNGTEEEPDNIIEVRLTLTNGNTSYSQTLCAVYKFLPTIALCTYSYGSYILKTDICSYSSCNVQYLQQNPKVNGFHEETFEAGLSK